MTESEKATAFDLLCEALINRWHDGTYSAHCSFLIEQPTHSTPAECIPDLLAWAERAAKQRGKQKS